jgi:hypothetical protein
MADLFLTIASLFLLLDWLPSYVSPALSRPEHYPEPHPDTRVQLHIRDAILCQP